jgi:pimeloyl-ACP methyl ester carboxylesterase
MAQIRVGDLTFEYERFGPADRETVLLIMGLGAQMTRWPVALCQELMARGFHVVRFDNRDIGLSSKLDDLGLPNTGALIAARAAGQPAVPPYTLDDMAADAVGLMDALGIARAHIVGASMGGMIAQLIVADHPARALSLTSIMSTTANPAVPPSTPEALAALLTPPAPAGDWDAIAARGVGVSKVIGSPGYPRDEAALRDAILADAQRNYHPQGMARQMAAVLCAPDRRPKLQTIAVPTVVLHGAVDPLVPVEGGKDTAANIPGAELRIVPGMGHDIPPALVTAFADAIEAAADRATTGRTPAGGSPAEAA